MAKMLTKEKHEQKCRVLVGVFLQTFRAWPFISGVTKYAGNVDCNVCIRDERKKIGIAHVLQAA